jgi:hypothetical protein
LMQSAWLQMQKALTQSDESSCIDLPLGSSNLIAKVRCLFNTIVEQSSHLSEVYGENVYLSARNVAKELFPSASGLPQ